MSTPQINWRLTLLFLGSLIVHGCLFLSVAIFTKTDSKKASIYRVSLRAHVPAPAAKQSKRTEPVLPAKPRAIEHTTVIANVFVMPAKAGIHTENPGPTLPGDDNQGAQGVDLSESAQPGRIVDAEYTSRAVEHGVEGDVVFDLTVSPDGRVQDAQFIRRIGYGLDESARIAILQSTFEAAKDSNGTAISGRVIYKYKFRIQNLQRRKG